MESERAPRCSGRQKSPMTHFRELQPSWNNRIAWLAVVPAVTGVVGVWNIRQIAGGNTPFAVMLFAAASMALSVWLLSLRLEIEVHDDALRLRYRFLRSPKQIEYSAIARAEAVRYQPVKGYGGWGLRRGKHEGKPEWVWASPEIAPCGCIFTPARRSCSGHGAPRNWRRPSTHEFRPLKYRSGRSLHLTGQARPAG